MTDAILQVRNLRVYYGTPGKPVRAVDGVSLDIGASEVVGLVGESGCGKSTLGRGILGLLPDGARADGEVLYDGRNLVAMPPKAVRRMRGPELGLIFQEPMTRLNPLLRISDHFRETLEQHEPNLTDAEVKRRSLETLGRDNSDPPASWLIHERWSSKGVCPIHQAPLRRATIGGRTTAWCPKCQPATRSRKP